MFSSLNMCVKISFPNLGKEHSFLIRKKTLSQLGKNPFSQLGKGQRHQKHCQGSASDVSLRSSNTKSRTCSCKHGRCGFLCLTLPLAYIIGNFMNYVNHFVKAPGVKSSYEADALLVFFKIFSISIKSSKTSFNTFMLY